MIIGRYAHSFVVPNLNNARAQFPIRVVVIFTATVSVIRSTAEQSVLEVP